MAQLLITASTVDGDVLPALALLGHTTKQIPTSPREILKHTSLFRIRLLEEFVEEM